ncbi:hypothetical protein [Actinomadura kijaniata]|uniref:hypothetical protein n=1 Tax=Actinomadura kijaniata TaxID=46161 RepID=UPI000B18D7F5|nr:hypothetical protein [Actinomadura kijaniata]
MELIYNVKEEGGDDVLPEGEQEALRISRAFRRRDGEKLRSLLNAFRRGWAGTRRAA